jgi:CheY-like chemotaxis protein
MISGRPAKILLIDSNVYFAKRLSDALKREGFEVLSSTQPAFALTTLEYDAPTAVVCATNMREMGALEIAKIIHADPKNSTLPIIALGDGTQRALMEAFQAGCEDYIDRQRPPAVIATHIRNIIISKAEGFQPTQMLAQADTSLSGSLTHHDLPGVLQMLGHAHQTGALHINAGATDALLFFDAGNITHAECGNLFGDEAVIHIIKSCIHGGKGVYKFVYGATSNQHTVLRNATDLMLDAMREYDESSRDSNVSPQTNASSFADKPPAAALDLNDALDADAAAPPEAQALLPVPLQADTEPNPSSTPDHLIKRSDLLQAELADYPTTITDRVLSDLLANDDNPVDRALADLLEHQQSAPKAAPLHTSAPHHADEAPTEATPSHDHSQDSSDFAVAHDANHEANPESADKHVPDKELP